MSYCGMSLLDAVRAPFASDPERKDRALNVKRTESMFSTVVSTAGGKAGGSS